MERKIKLIWDFRGAGAEKTAEHHEKHLKEFIASEGTALNITGCQEVNDRHSYAFMVVEESEMIAVRNALKPHRGVIYVPNPKQTRINKYLSEVGYCSRRAADRLIEQGRVTINGQVPEMGTKITDGDEVRVDGKRISDPQEKPVYLAFNKPVGIVCTTDTRVEKDNIIDFIDYPKRIFPIGRLDKRSEGLILLTDDGDIVNKILRARNNHEKEYLVTVDQPITNEFLEKMRNGVPILDTVTRKCKVAQINDHEFKMVLTQGLNRQIRRMCEYLDYRVKRLKRIRIMNVKLDVPVGKWRNLTDAELKEIHRLTAASDKTE